MNGCSTCGGFGDHHDPIAHGAGGFCHCGGELLDWCTEHGDWVCDDCDCWLFSEDEWHDRQHPVWNEGCEECQWRAERIEEGRLEAIATGADPDEAAT